MWLNYQVTFYELGQTVIDKYREDEGFSLEQERPLPSNALQSLHFQGFPDKIPDPRPLSRQTTLFPDKIPPALLPVFPERDSYMLST